MSFPKLKNAALCRALVYLIILFCFAAPVVLSLLLPLSDGVRVAILLLSLISFLVYLFKRFVFLLTLDATLAAQHCHNTAREHFMLPSSFRAEKAKRRLSSYGRGASPLTACAFPSSPNIPSRTAAYAFSARAFSEGVCPLPPRPYCPSRSATRTTRFGA